MTDSSSPQAAVPAVASPGTGAPVAEKRPLLLYCPTCECDVDWRNGEHTRYYYVQGMAMNIMVDATVCATCGECLAINADDQAMLDRVYAIAEGA